MPTSDGSVEIRITGSVDPSVASSANAAKTAINDIAASSGTLAKAEAVTATAVRTETVAMAASTTAHVSNRAATEALVIAHELLQGRTSRVAGSAMILAQNLGIAASAETLLAVGAGAAVVGIGYLLYQEAQAEEQARSLAAAFVLTGQGAGVTADGVRGEIAALAALPGVSQDAATGLVEFDSAHAAVSKRLQETADQLIPAYAVAFGDKATEAVNKLKESLAGIENSNTIEQMVHEFDDLNRSTLHLDDGEAKIITNLLLMGKASEATTRILEDMGQRGGVQIESVDDQIAQINAKLQDEQNITEAIKETNGAAFDPSVPEAFAESVSESAAAVASLRGQLAGLLAIAGDDESRALDTKGRLAGGGLGDAGHFRPHHHGGGGHSHQDPDKKQVEEWAKQQEDADLKVKADSGNANQSMLADDVRFWQGKLEHVTKYSALWYDIQAKLQPLLAKQTDEEVRDVLRGEEEKARARDKALAQQKQDTEAAVRDIIDGLHREEEEHKKQAEEWAKENAIIARSMHQVIDPVISSIGNQIKGLVEGTETWGKALLNIGESVMSTLIAGVERWAEAQIVAAVTGQTAQEAANRAQINQAAEVAAANTYKAVSAIPIVGPYLAPEAAAAAFVAVEAFGSYAQGANVVPTDMIAQVHAGERIIPAADNSALMAAVGAGRGSRGGDAYHSTYAPTFHTYEQPSLRRLLEREPSEMHAFMRQAVRDGHLKAA